MRWVSRLNRLAVSADPTITVPCALGEKLYVASLATTIRAGAVRRRSLPFDPSSPCVLLRVCGGI